MISCRTLKFLTLTNGGGLKSDGRQDGLIPKDDGVHRIIWNESEIIYKISKSHLLEESETVLVGLNAAISKRSEKMHLSLLEEEKPPPLMLQ